MLVVGRIYSCSNNHSVFVIQSFINSIRWFNGIIRCLGGFLPQHS